MSRDTWELEAKPRIEAPCPALPPVHQKLGISEPGRAASGLLAGQSAKELFGDRRETGESLNIL